MVLPTCLRTLILPKHRKKLPKHLKPDTIKTICECVINIINKNIKLSDQDKSKSTEITIRFENT